MVAQSLPLVTTMIIIILLWKVLNKRLGLQSVLTKAILEAFRIIIAFCMGGSKGYLDLCVFKFMNAHNFCIVLKNQIASRIS